MAGRDPDDRKLVVLVRNDLKMTKGKIAAQVAHAAVNCAFASKKKDAVNFNAWYDSGQAKVVLRVDSERELFEFKAVAEALGITCSLITDAGRTQIEPGSITCLGIGPEKVSVLDKITGDLKML
ncbi:MAG: peptidyl-tRNA hydrolase Pth2 [Candidatus Methanomethylophilaceae archaeon]|jgi:PTH2 family peptidyl-tRNA hydrolase|nr:peptidyl-tRNA hydrolase Pth2 [Candidatus Methanomethylophilaceae archaeon]NCA73770.1 peptidyl-tRNA hydrolase [Gammaproteobacteria bacterium]MDD2935666.1 peptidyl-tRNA hydrolase Pth2 [Candidatus Methanomethylophilaceae archaeon]MDD3351958.1 peptidyl-tRNA hydrolase Pth2 [Candidatus Methanomethylophilaceae archaeon]MDD3987057.1 peptidyl-tRNA hydrolase Pth2 [Candidatus Methanomethylophilaceae archaeon]